MLLRRSSFVALVLACGCEKLFDLPDPSSPPPRAQGAAGVGGATAGPGPDARCRADLAWSSEGSVGTRWGATALDDEHAAVIHGAEGRVWLERVDTGAGFPEPMELYQNSSAADVTALTPDVYTTLAGWRDPTGAWRARVESYAAANGSPLAFGTVRSSPTPFGELRVTTLPMAASPTGGGGASGVGGGAGGPTAFASLEPARLLALVGDAAGVTAHELTESGAATTPEGVDLPAITIGEAAVIDLVALVDAGGAAALTTERGAATVRRFERGRGQTVTRAVDGAGAVALSSTGTDLVVTTRNVDGGAELTRLSGTSLIEISGQVGVATPAVTRLARVGASLLGVSVDADGVAVDWFAPEDIAVRQRLACDGCSEFGPDLGVVRVAAGGERLLWVFAAFDGEAAVAIAISCDLE